MSSSKAVLDTRIDGAGYIYLETSWAGSGVNSPLLITTNSEPDTTAMIYFEVYLFHDCQSIQFTLERTFLTDRDPTAICG